MEAVAWNLLHGSCCMEPLLHANMHLAPEPHKQAVHFPYWESCKDAHTGIRTDKASDQHRHIHTEAFTRTQDLTT